MSEEMQTTLHADIRHYPYMTSIQELQLGERHLCAGIILTMSWVLTAAHCLMHPGPVSFTRDELIRDPSFYLVLAGTEDYSFGFQETCKLFLVHYNASLQPTNFHQGLALVGVNHSFSASQQVKPAKYAQTRKEFRFTLYETKCEVIGWSRFDHENIQKFRLMKFEVTVMSRRNCHELQNEANMAHSDQYICLKAVSNLPWLDLSSAVVCSNATTVDAIVVSKFVSDTDSSIYLALRLDYSALWIATRIQQPAISNYMRATRTWC